MKPQMTQASPAFVSHSAQTGSNYVIYADTPRDAAGSWNSVLLMDGDFFFDTAAAVARSLQAEGRIGPTALFGVGYGASFGKPGNFRGRDYTHTASAEEPSSGGADRFLAYLTDTLWPELAGRHPISAGRSVIAGHSLGSLLVLHALFQPRPFFGGALASAPSIWWDNRSILGRIASLRDAQDSLEGRLYLGCGADDSPSMTGDLVLMEGLLERRPFRGLQVHSELFQGKDHYNVVPFTVRDGLATLLN
jgi:predicted alpha/beta superfamily hydrolase